MELSDVSANSTDTGSGSQSGALAVASDQETGTVTAYLNDEQLQTIVGESIFSDMTFETQLGLFASSIPIGFGLASLALVIKLGIGAIRRLFQRI